MKSHWKSYHRNCGHWSTLLEEGKDFLSVSFMSTLGISVAHTVSRSCSQNPKRRLRNDNESAFRVQIGTCESAKKCADWLASGHLCCACDDMRHPCGRGRRAPIKIDKKTTETPEWAISRLPWRDRGEERKGRRTQELGKWWVVVVRAFGDFIFSSQHF